MHLNNMIFPLFSNYSIMWVLRFYKIQNKVLYIDKTTEMGYTIQTVLYCTFLPHVFLLILRTTEQIQIPLSQNVFIFQSSDEFKILHKSLPNQPRQKIRAGGKDIKHNDTCLPCTYLTSTNSLRIPS